MSRHYLRIELIVRFLRTPLRRLAKYLIVNRNSHKTLQDVNSATPIYKLGTQTLMDLKFPIQINLEASRACNLKCPFCAREDATSGTHIDLKIVQKVVEEAKKYGPTVFALHIWGEPLINPKWDEIVHIIKSSNKSNGVTITTNGTLFTPKNIEKLKRDKVDQLIISLHTLDSKTYPIRVGKDISLQDQLDSLRELAIQTKNLSMVKVIRLFETKEDKITQTQLISELKELGYNFEITEYDNSAGFRDDWSTIETKEKRWPCYHPWLTASVTVHGDVTICCVDPINQLKIGNIQNEDLNSMWTGRRLQEIRHQHLKQEFESNCSICEKCDTWAAKPDFFFNFQK